VNPASVGIGFEVLVQITLERGDASTVASFEAPWSSCPDPARRTPLRRPPLPAAGHRAGTSTVSRHCGTRSWPRCQAYTASPQPSWWNVSSTTGPCRSQPEVAKNARPQPHRQSRQTQRTLIGTTRRAGRVTPPALISIRSRRRQSTDRSDRCALADDRRAAVSRTDRRFHARAATGWLTTLC